MQFTKTLLVATFTASTLLSCAQDKSTRPSPPATAKATLTNGNTITIDYSAPSIKGRTIGKDIAPFGKVWRTGANEATTIEFTKDATINGKTVKAGKYALFTIPNESEWTVIINTNAKQWGAGSYKEAEDVARFSVKPAKNAATEKMNFTVAENGTVTWAWGEASFAFEVK